MGVKRSTQAQEHGNLEFGFVFGKYLSILIKTTFVPESRVNFNKIWKAALMGVLTFQHCLSWSESAVAYEGSGGKGFTLLDSESSCANIVAEQCARFKQNSSATPCEEKEKP